MVSELRMAKGTLKITTSLKKSLNKCSMVASHLKKGIKELWNLLLSIWNNMTKTSTKDNSGASRHKTGEHKKLKTPSRGKYSYSIEIGDKKSYPIRGIGSTSLDSSQQHPICYRFAKESTLYFMSRS